MKTKHPDRKAQMSNVTAMILIAACAIVMLIFIMRYIDKTSYEEVINTCRFSVMAQSASEWQLGVTGRKSPLDINCEKRYVKFYDTKVEMGLNPENMKSIAIDFEGEKVKKFRGLTDHVVDQVLAEELRICKYQFSDGKVEVFANNDNVLWGKNICFICSEIDFEPTVKQQAFSTLTEYTQKATFDDTGTKYYDYLTEESYTRNVMWAQPNYVLGDKVSFMFKNTFWDSHPNGGVQYSNLAIDKSKKYYVFFEKYNPSTLFDASKGNKDVTVTDPKLVEQYWVAIVPAEDINDYCSIQAN